MTISDLVMIVVSTTLVGGLYLVGWYAKRAQRHDPDKYEKK